MSSRDRASADLSVGPPQSQPNPAESLLEKLPLLHPEGERWIRPKFLTPLGAQPMAAHNPQLFFPEGIPDLPEVASADFQPTEFFPDSQFPSKASTRAEAPALQRRVEVALPGGAERLEPGKSALPLERGSRDFSELLGIEPAAAAPATVEPAAIPLIQARAEEAPEALPDFRANAPASPPEIQRRVSSAASAPEVFSPGEPVGPVDRQGSGPSESLSPSGVANLPRIQAVSPSVESMEFAERVDEPSEPGTIAPPDIQAFTRPTPTIPTPGLGFSTTNPIAPPVFAAEPEFASPVVSTSGAEASPPPLQTRLTPVLAWERVTPPEYPFVSESAQIPEGAVDPPAIETQTGAETLLAAQGPETAAIAASGGESALPSALPETGANAPTIAAADPSAELAPLPVQAKLAPAPEQPLESIASVAASNRAPDGGLPAVQRQHAEVATTPAPPGAAADGGHSPSSELSAPLLEASVTATSPLQAISPLPSSRPDAPALAPAAIDRLASSLAPETTPITEPEIIARSIDSESDATETDPILVLGDSRLTSEPAAEATAPAVGSDFFSGASEEETITPAAGLDMPSAATDEIAVSASDRALSSSTATVATPMIQPRQELTAPPAEHRPAIDTASPSRWASPDVPPIAPTSPIVTNSPAEASREVTTTAENALPRAADRVSPSDSALRNPQIQKQDADETSATASSLSALEAAIASGLSASDASVTADNMADNDVIPTAASFAAPDRVKASGNLPGIQPKSAANADSAVIPASENAAIASEAGISTAASLPEGDEAAALPLIQSKGETSPVVSVASSAAEVIVSEAFPIAERAAETVNESATQPKLEASGSPPDAPPASRKDSDLPVLPPVERRETARERAALQLEIEANPASAAPPNGDERAPAAVSSGEVVAGDADLSAIQPRLERHAAEPDHGLLSPASGVPDAGDRPTSAAAETGTSDATPQETPTSTSTQRIPHLSTAPEHLAGLRPLPPSQPLVQRDPIPAAELPAARQPDASQPDAAASGFSPGADRMNSSAAGLPGSSPLPNASPTTADDERASSVLTGAESAPADEASPADTRPLADAGPTPPLGQSAASAEPQIQTKADNPTEGAPILARADSPAQEFSANPTAAAMSSALRLDSSAGVSDSIPDQWSSIEDLLTQTTPMVQRRLDNLSDWLPAPMPPSGPITADLPPTPPTTPLSLADGAVASPFSLSVTPTTEETTTDDRTPEELSGKQASAQEESDNLERLAREVYHLLRQRIEIEQERSGGYYRDRRF